MGGDVRIYDIRGNKTLFTNKVTHTQDLTAISIHRSADIYAWWVLYYLSKLTNSILICTIF